MKKVVGVFLIAVFGAVSGALVTGLILSGQVSKEVVRIEQPTIMKPVNFSSSTGATVVENPDFIKASAVATPAVVHIKSSLQVSAPNDRFHQFFGGPGMRGQASGSGVIISEDGYIATNNHVIDGASQVEVILNDKRSFKAKVIGADPTTDLALLKVDAQQLPSLSYGNSDNVQIGEWVLAVGNPFNLTSTVTAGIVSAKGRSLNLLNEEFAIESFIQTDAAVNPGNSGGALINTKGELVGINTAIASETGSYAGYSFAVPVNIVRKVMADLKEFGKVQRGIIGVQIQNINAQFAEKEDLTTLNGAYIAGVIPGGAAEKAGIKRGDIITGVEGAIITSASELQELIGRYRPGDKVSLSVIRGKKKLTMPVILQNKQGNTKLSALLNEIKKEDLTGREETLGATLRSLSDVEKKALNVVNGVKVEKIEEGRLKQIGLEKSFIITKVNKQKVDSPKQVKKEIEESDGIVLIEGIDSSGNEQFYAFNN